MLARRFSRQWQAGSLPLVSEELAFMSGASRKYPWNFSASSVALITTSLRDFRCFSTYGIRHTFFQWQRLSFTAFANPITSSGNTDLVTIFIKDTLMGSWVYEYEGLKKR